ncbi:MAG TPA: zinc-dependent alcohol dehydrogenase family protein [Chloroflexota bacterium]|nr:zinc-dependent alcohol dehydrogenase family protein [Chloroflexota bacterium]
MRAAVFHGAGDIRVEQVPDPRIEEPTDAVVRITHAAICGSDLWPYRGFNPWQAGWRIGHEWLGVVEDVGTAVDTVRRGDWVLAPFSFSDGTCEFCRRGLQSSCVQAGFWGTTRDGGQGEAIRVPMAAGTLVPIPKDVDRDEALLTKMLLLTDVMATGHHAAVSAGVRAGGTVAVVGDGAVGLCGVLAAQRLGAERIIAVGHHADRLALAQRFGATDLVSGTDAEAIAQVQDLTSGGAASVMECVGHKTSMDVAFAIARAGGTVGFVGQPHGSEVVNIRRMYRDNVALRGGIAPVRAYIPELMIDVLAGTLDPSPVLDQTVSLSDVSAGYVAMDTRQALKVLVRM